MSQKNLKQKAVKGVVWTALQKYSTMLIQFVSGIILARLLTPYDYGCIGTECDLKPLGAEVVYLRHTEGVSSSLLLDKESEKVEE